MPPRRRPSQRAARPPTAQSQGPLQRAKQSVQRNTHFWQRIIKSQQKETKCLLGIMKRSLQRITKSLQRKEKANRLPKKAQRSLQRITKSLQRKEAYPNFQQGRGGEGGIPPPTHEPLQNA